MRFPSKFRLGLVLCVYGLMGLILDPQHNRQAGFLLSVLAVGIGCGLILTGGPKEGDTGK